jgi:hypothetical protein
LSPLLQKAFEEEYCGGLVSPQRRYFDARRRQNEEPIDYLYRLNVLAQEARLDYESGANAVSHVQHFLDTCEDPDLARQFGVLQLPDEEKLRAALKGLLHQTTRLKRGEATTTRNNRRDGRNDRDRDRDIRFSVGRPKEGSRDSPDLDQHAQFSELVDWTLDRR